MLQNNNSQKFSCTLELWKVNHPHNRLPSDARKFRQMLHNLIFAIAQLLVYAFSIIDLRTIQVLSAHVGHGWCFFIQKLTSFSLHIIHDLKNLCHKIDHTDYTYMSGKYCMQSSRVTIIDPDKVAPLLISGLVLGQDQHVG